MRCLKFRLMGKTGFFKKAEFNVNTYFTYNNIHKPALLGLLGAIVGYGGYGQQGEKDIYPEYYARLKDLKVSIVPISDNDGVFTKKKQYFNNSVGYASDEEGGNLIVREQWLENPCWDIYIMDDGSEAYSRVEGFILRGEAVYMPYLGKNDHPAVISEAAVIDIQQGDSGYVDSIVVDYPFDAQEFEGYSLFYEYVPVAMDSVYNHAIYKNSVFTDGEYDMDKLGKVYEGDDRILYFF